MTLIETKRIHQIFVDHGYVWKMDGQYKIPTEKDIAEALQKMKSDLKDEPDLSTHWMGRLLVKKESGCYDVYIMMGRL